MLRSILTYTTRIVLVVIFLPITYLLLAFLLGAIPTGENNASAKDGIEIFVETNGVHTDFVLPIKSEAIDWHTYFPFAHFRNGDLADKSHISFGWGDRGFYLETPNWSDLKFSTAFKAFFLTSRTAMHVTYRNRPTRTKTRKSVVLSPAQYDQLVHYILDSFQQDPVDKVVLIPDQSYWGYDAFYAGTGSYNLRITCNEWTGRGLRRLGIKTGIWTPLAQSILFHL
ncbi:MAG: TIGR02117 family protein [Rhodothermales bacterium]